MTNTTIYVVVGQLLKGVRGYIQQIIIATCGILRKDNFSDEFSEKLSFFFFIHAALIMERALAGASSISPPRPL